MFMDQKTPYPKYSKVSQIIYKFNWILIKIPMKFFLLYLTNWSLNSYEEQELDNFGKEHKEVGWKEGLTYKIQNLVVLQGNSN